MLSKSSSSTISYEVPPLEFLKEVEQQQLQSIRHDPIQKERLSWHGQLCRHLSNLMPGQTILELGRNDWKLAETILQITRGENHITRLDSTMEDPGEVAEIEFIDLKSHPNALKGRQFDLIIATLSFGEKKLDLLYQFAWNLLAPGGKLVLISHNPWNTLQRIKGSIVKNSKLPVFKYIETQDQLHQHIKRLGFVRVFSFHYDFVYPVLTPRFSWFFCNFSILLENLPVIKKFSRSLIIHAQKPAKSLEITPAPILVDTKLDNTVSVVIPCHNEEPNIVPLVAGLKSLYGRSLREIILVDDNSRDNTRQVILTLAQQDPSIIPVLRNPPNGVGRALRDGYQAASGEYILSMDCDFIQILPELRGLFDALAEGYDMVVGSRFSRQRILLNYPWPKIVANRSFHILARLLLRRHFRDLTNNLKIFRRKLLEDLTLTQDGFAINAELGLKPLLMGYSIKEVPVSWINRTPGMGQSSFRLIKVGKAYFKVLMEARKATKNKTPLKKQPTQN